MSEDQVLIIKQDEAILKLARMTVCSPMAQDGKLPAFQLGGSWWGRQHGCERQMAGQVSGWVRSDQGNA